MTMSWTFSTALLTYGISCSPKEIPSSSTCDLRIVTCPARLSCMVSAMRFAVPSLLSTASVSFSKSLSDPLTTASHPAMAFLPKIADAAAACSVSDISPIFFLRDTMVSRRFTDPSLFSTSAMPYLSMYDFICFVGFARFVSPVLSAVPAFDALTPAFAISPTATAVSSMEAPRAPATGAAYWNVSPIIATLVLAFDDAAAMISASLPESCADFPKAVSASVTMSDVVARSSPDAAARSMIPSTPLSMSPVFHPAIAM